MALWLEIHEGGRVRIHEISAAAVTLGRGADNDVVLDDPRASRRHCRIERTPQGFLLEDLDSRNGTILNGYAVKKSFLKPGDEIRVGSVRLFLREGDQLPSPSSGPAERPQELDSTEQPAQTVAPGEASTSERAAFEPGTRSLPSRVPAPASLEALTGPHAGTKILIERTPFVLGRSKEADFQLDDRRASGLHAQIVYEDGVFKVEDLGSTNGTLLGKRLIQRAVLTPGAVLQIGASAFRVHVPPVSDAIVDEGSADDFVEFDKERFFAKSRAEHPAVVAALVFVLAVLGYFAIDLARRAVSQAAPDPPDRSNLIGETWSFEIRSPAAASKASAVPGWQLYEWTEVSEGSEPSGARLEITRDHAKVPGFRALRIVGASPRGVALGGHEIGTGIRAGVAYRLEGRVVNETAQAAGLVVEWIREARESKVVLGRSYSETARSPRESVEVDQVVYAPTGTLAARVACFVVGAGSAVFDRISLSEHAEPSRPETGDEATAGAEYAREFPSARHAFPIGSPESKSPLFLVAGQDGTFSVERPRRQPLVLGIWAALPPERDPHQLGPRLGATRALTKERGSLTYVTDTIDLASGGWVPVECKAVLGRQDLSVRWRAASSERGQEIGGLALYLELPEATLLQAYREGSPEETSLDQGPVDSVREALVGHGEDRISIFFSVPLRLRRASHPFDKSRELFVGETDGLELEAGVSRRSRFRLQAALAGVREAERLFRSGEAAQAFRSLEAIAKTFPEEEDAVRLAQERLGEWRRALTEELRALQEDAEELRATGSSVLYRILKSRVGGFIGRYAGTPEAAQAQALRDDLENVWKSRSRSQREKALQEEFELGRDHFSKDQLYLAELYLRSVSEESPDSDIGREAKSLLSRIAARIEGRRKILLK